MSDMIRDDLKASFLYNRWADARISAAIRDLGPDHFDREPAPGWSSVGSTFFHLAGANTVWARRLAGETVTSRPNESDYPTVEHVADFLSQAHDALDAQLSARSPAQLLENFAYRNLQGVDATVPLWSVFRHIVNHATYHRGQIASKIKLLGGEPPVTDLLYWAIDHRSS